MSDDRRLSLGEYIAALVDGVAAAEPDSAERLYKAVGARRARIAVDDEQVVVLVEDGQLEILSDAPDVDGEGVTDRQTVIDLLDGRLEVTQAVLSDRLRLFGSPDAVVRISRAIETILDVSVRAPVLQRLADRYRAETPLARAPAQPPRAATVDAELALLRRLGLLPD